MKKILVIFLVLSMTVGFVAAHMHHPPSFNVKMTEGGSMMINHGDPMGSAIFTNGNMVKVIVRGLEAETYYSLHYGSDCVDFDMKTNRHGNLYSGKVEWDYSDIYEMVDVPLGGDVPMLKSGEAQKFELKNFKCSASTGEEKLKGVSPKHWVRIKYS